MTSAPTDLSFVLTMPGEFDLAGLTCPEIPPAKNVALQKGDYFAYLAQHDLLLALPYQSINPFVDLLYEAADDPARRQQPHRGGAGLRGRARQAGAVPARAARPL